MTSFSHSQADSISTVAVDTVPVIRVRDLRKSYGRIVAVDGISFDVAGGETYGLLGPNGAGKTTTMRILSALSPASSGELTVAGIDVRGSGREVRYVLGVVTQHDGLDESITVIKNLSIHGYLCGLGRREAQQRAEEVLDFFGLADRANSNIYELSGGMRRRIAIARGLVAKPSVMILDEPTTGLDPQSRNRVWEQLATMKSTGVTILMSTHYMEEASALCDRLAIMDHGKVLAEGEPDSLVDKYAGHEVAQIRAEPWAIGSIRESLDSQGYRYAQTGAMLSVVVPPAGFDVSKLSLNGARVMRRPGNLEDVFLALTGRELRNE